MEVVTSRVIADMRLLVMLIENFQVRDVFQGKVAPAWWWGTMLVLAGNLPSMQRKIAYLALVNQIRLDYLFPILIDKADKLAIGNSFSKLRLHTRILHMQLTRENLTVTKGYIPLR
jgi:hypothetical protein